jgi:ABC-type transport system substrate-binding protein
MMRWEDVATAGANGPDWARALNGLRFPLPDRVELVDIPEPTTALLALERGDIDILSAPIAAIANNRLVARLAGAGFTLVRAPSPTLSWFSFNMADPQVGGFAPVNIALRRAIAMSIDDAEYIRLFDNGAAALPDIWIPADILGHDPTYRNPIRYDPVTANALLDHFGYRKGSDGFRRSPDGRVLALTFTVGTGSRERQWSEFMKHSIDRVGIRVRFDAVDFAEIVSRQVSCRFQIHGTGGWVFDWPDASNLMVAFYGKSMGSVNEPCMHDPQFDALYERLLDTPVTARASLYRLLIDRLNALTPVRLMPQRDELYLVAPGVRGFVIHPAPGPNYAAFPYIDVRTKRAGAGR